MIGWIRRRPVLAAVIGVCVLAVGVVAVVFAVERITRTSPAEEFLDDVDAADLRGNAADDRQLVSEAKAFCRGLDEGDQPDDVDELHRLAVVHFCPEHRDVVEGTGDEGRGRSRDRPGVPSV